MPKEGFRELSANCPDSITLCVFPWWRDSSFAVDDDLSIALQDKSIKSLPANFVPDSVPDGGPAMCSAGIAIYASRSTRQLVSR